MFGARAPTGLLLVSYFCHKCTACTDDTDCPSLACGTGTCGSVGVCFYTLERQNVLHITLTIGDLAEDTGFILTENVAPLGDKDIFA